MFATATPDAMASRTASRVLIPAGGSPDGVLPTRATTGSARHRSEDQKLNLLMPGMSEHMPGRDVGVLPNSLQRTASIARYRWRSYTRLVADARLVSAVAPWQHHLEQAGFPSADRSGIRRYPHLAWRHSAAASVRSRCSEPAPDSSSYPSRFRHVVHSYAPGRMSVREHGQRRSPASARSVDSRCNSGPKVMRVTPRRASSATDALDAFAAMFSGPSIPSRNAGNTSSGASSG